MLTNSCMGLMTLKLTMGLATLEHWYKLMPAWSMTPKVATAQPIVSQSGVKRPAPVAPTEVIDIKDVQCHHC